MTATAVPPSRCPQRIPPPAGRLQDLCRITLKLPPAGRHATRPSRCWAASTGSPAPLVGSKSYRFDRATGNRQPATGNSADITLPAGTDVRLLGVTGTADTGRPPCGSASSRRTRPDRASLTALARATARPPAGGGLQGPELPFHTPVRATAFTAGAAAGADLCTGRWGASGADAPRTPRERARSSPPFWTRRTASHPPRRASPK